jgi:hypothetical protein
MEQEITMKNTKSEMLEALNAALARAAAAESGKLNPVKAEKEKAEKEAVKSAREAVEQNIFSAELVGKFKDLQTAIAAEEARLKELYGAGEELQKLALIIEAGRERQAQIDTENKTKVEEANAVIERLRAEYAGKKAELQEEYEVMAKKLKTERERELEEYQYAKEREREKENNAWADEKAAREAELAKKEEQARIILAEAESKTEYVKGLETKAEAIPSLLEAEKEAAVNAAAAELTKTHGHKIALIEKDHQNAMDRANDKVAYLEKELAASDKNAAALQNKLDKAYAEIRELATKTVESASGVKIIGTGGEPPQRHQ